MESLLDGKVSSKFFKSFLLHPFSSLIAFGILSGAGACAAKAQENVIDYIPSSLLKPGQVELKFFNNLYTQTVSFDSGGNRRDDSKRSTYFTGIYSFLYGLSDGSNIGVDFYLKSVRVDDKSSSAFSVLGFSGGLDARTALAYIAPKVKLVPWRRIPRLAFQTSLLIPSARHLQGRPAMDKPFLDYDAIQWWNQFFYDHSIGKDFMYYFEQGLLFRFFTERIDVVTPLKLIFNFYPSKKSILYSLAELAPTWDGLAWGSYYSQVGLGAKYQLASYLEVESLLSLFPFGKLNGAGQTYNLGIRIIHWQTRSVSRF